MLYWYYKLYNKLHKNSKYILYDAFNNCSLYLYKAKYINNKWYYYYSFHDVWKAFEYSNCVEIK